MTEIFTIFFSACLVNNLILSGMLGIAPAMSVTKKLEVAIGMSITMMFVLIITASVAYLFKVYFLQPLGLEYLELISFIVIISLSVLLTFAGLKKFKPAFCEEVSLFLPLTLINTAVLGTALLSVQNEFGLIGTVFFGIGSGLGLALLVPMIAAIEERINVANIPVPFQGAAIMLITFGLLSMAFMGFVGMGSY